MQDFSIYHVLATIACIALFIWLRIRLFGKLNNADGELCSQLHYDATLVPAPAELVSEQLSTASTEASVQHK